MDNQRYIPLGKYYDAGSTRVAMRTGISTLNYSLGDHLGSQAITTSSSGAMSAEIRYNPWGTERYSSGTTPTTYHFTGQRLESALGLYYYGARWYDPTAGRFIQADTLIPQQQGVQAWDRYAYTNNSPVNYTDPSGHSCPPNQCDYIHDYDEAFSPINELIHWRKTNNEATFTDENWFSEHPTYNPNNDEFLSYTEQYIRENGSYFGVTESDIYDIRLRYSLYQASKSTSFNEMATLFMMAGSTGANNTNTSAIQEYWPSNNGFHGEPFRTYLMPGTIVDRYGYPGGSFLSPLGTPFEMRSLPPSSAYAPYSVYKVLKPLEVTAGNTMPAFGYTGGGMQFKTPVSIQILLEKGILSRIR